jgi:hypothetical protein
MNSAQEKIRIEQYFILDERDDVHTVNLVGSNRKILCSNAIVVAIGIAYRCNE